MGIVYYGRGYINRPPWRENVSRQRAFIALTHQNIQFLISLGFRVTPGGR